MKKLFAYFLNAYLLALFVSTLYLAHVVTFKKIEMPSLAAKDYPALPDFAAFKLVEDKKAAFFSYFGEIIDDENYRILAQRDALLAVGKKLQQGKKLTQNENNIVAQLARRYGISQAQEGNTVEQQLNALLLRVDIVPRSLALVQAAKESAWGTSRFARQGNNFFGQWCFKEGCGIVPRRRGRGAHHEVRTFSSAGASVSAYLFNINTHRAYREFRAIRKSLRDTDQQLTGLELAQGLSHYSERGEAYVAEVQNMIKANHLQDQSSTLDEQLGTR